MSAFNLKIYASDKVVYDGMCNTLTVPAIDGEKGILGSHENCVIAVAMGETRFEDESGKRDALLTGNGFVQVLNGDVTMLVQTAERAEDIDEVRARMTKERAEERLRQELSMQEYYHSQAELVRALARLKYKAKK